jgi:hypothetical protein
VSHRWWFASALAGTVGLCLVPWTWVALYLSNSFHIALRVVYRSRGSWWGVPLGTVLAAFHLASQLSDESRVKAAGNLLLLAVIVLGSDAGDKWLRRGIRSVSSALTPIGEMVRRREIREAA